MQIKLFLAPFTATIIFSGSAFATDDMIVNNGKEPPQEVLQRFDLPGTDYRHCGMSVTTYSPDSKKPLHKHTGPEVGFVLEGELILSLEGRPEQIIRAGESFQIPVDVLHTTEAGPSGAKVIATWLLKS